MNDDNIKKANDILDEMERKQQPPPKKKTAKTKSESAAKAKIAELAKLNELAYQKQRKAEAEALGLTLAALDKLIRQQREAQSEKDSGLAHWKVEPWDGDVSGADLLDDFSAIFSKYIFLPKAAAPAAALWVLHSWTFDAGDISPFLTLVSPEKRCGKTSMLILLMYLTPKSELASNISPSALYRYVEEVHPTLLIDEADSFFGDNEELRGLLNSGHTRVAANVIRNVEVNGRHKPHRFSTWTPKAIATIQQLADTLEDRSIIIQLRRKPKAMRMTRLRKRDNEEFAILRRKAAKWAEAHFAALTVDTDPEKCIWRRHFWRFSKRRRGLRRRIEKRQLSFLPQGFRRIDG
jgi:putative DNA primase/helicase